jgi:hypothetical protein
VVRQRKGEYRKELAELMKKGFQRVKIDGQYYEIADVPPLDKKFKHDIDVVVDRIVVREDIATRLADSLETCLRLADGLAIAAPTSRCRRGNLGRRLGQQVRTRPMSGCSSLRSSPARSPASPFPRSSHGCFPSTTRMVPARPAMAWAPRRPSTRR